MHTLDNNCELIYIKMHFFIFLTMHGILGNLLKNQFKNIYIISVLLFEIQLSQSITKKAIACMIHTHPPPV